MMRRLVLLTGACVALSVSADNAQIYKCIAPDGRISFEDRPCTEGTQQVLPTRRIPVEGEPAATDYTSADGAPSDAGAATSAATVAIDASQPMVSGTIYGEPFSFTRARLFNPGVYALEIKQGAALRPDKGITIFLWDSENAPIAGRVFNVPDPSLSQQPQIILIWTTFAGDRRQEEITSGYTMKLAFGQPTNGTIDGQISLSLPNRTALDITGRFVAEIDY